MEICWVESLPVRLIGATNRCSFGSDRFSGNWAFRFGGTVLLPLKELLSNKFSSAHAATNHEYVSPSYSSIASFRIR